MTNEQTIALPSGYQLENYRLETVLGHGGFGITYRAKDGDLRKTVAIKEYLPREVAFRGQDSTVVPLSEGDRETFEWGLERFLDEARTLARFGHPNIVGVHRFLRVNGTAYLVMDYCAGESLEHVLVREGTLSPERLEAMLVPLVDALEALHAAGVTHRDIKPGNIYLRDDGSPILLDFGAARQALAQHSRSVTAMATPGYAAFEQYSTKGKQGPWTDIYGLGATLYRCVTGQRPPDASDRMLEDELVPTAEVASDCYPRPLLQQIDAALKLRPQDRPQSIAAWRRFGVEGVASQPREREAVAPPVVEPQAPAPSPAREPAAATGSGRGWVWLLIVGAVIGFFIWAGSEQSNPQPSATATRDSPVWDHPQPSATATRDSPVLHLAPPRSQDAADSSVPGGLIESRYQLVGAQGEIVRDTVSGLAWERCSLGQTWSGSTCVGEASRFNWEEARQVAERVPGWRLPTIVELKTLAYCSSGRPAYFSNGEACGANALRPTIVQEVFPNTPSSYFWSGSPGAYGSKFAWGVLFANGKAGYGGGPGGNSHVRLVRGGLTAQESEETEADTDSAAVARHAEIERLLNDLEEDLAADRLTIPPGRNALERVKAILDLSPDHEGAMEGLRRIMVRYEELTSVALAGGELDRAEALLRRMDEVQAGTSAASDLRDQISRAREEREQARLASALIAGRYRILGASGEIVEDTTTDLQWQRCSLGQIWNGRTCVGEAGTYTWEEARQAADRVAGWRLPTVAELRTLTFCTSGQPARFSQGEWCQGDYGRPTIVQEAFSNTPSSGFWSGSPGANGSYYAWFVSFSFGNAFNGPRSSDYRVRLVRGGQ